MNKKKLLAISILPAMWIVYTLFETICGRITNISTIFLNVGIIIIFSLCGLLIYNIGKKYEKGLKFNFLLIIFLILMLVDQGIKLIIKFNFFHNYFEIIPSLLSFNPIINTNGSWLNARFGTSVSFSLLICLNIAALLIFLELYRYYLYNNIKDFWADMCFVFIFAGALCSLIDKVFYGGSLDFIGISNLFIADIKDIYINLSIVFFIITISNNGYFSEDNDTTLKDDLKSLKKFVIFIKDDLKQKHKLFK